MRWTPCKLSRFFFIPEGLHVPFSYVRCTCVKCEWPEGRAPLYPSDAIRNYQRRHKDQVVVPIPPPATCRGDRNLLDPILQCGCKRCEESRNCAVNESYARVDRLRLPERHSLSRLLSGSDAPKTVDLLYSSASGDPYHLRFTAPYTHRVYELLNLPKPAQIWEEFGVPASMVGDGEGEMDGVDAGSEGLETEDKEQEVVKVSKGELDGKAAVVTMREGEGEGVPEKKRLEYDGDSDTTNGSNDDNDDNSEDGEGRVGILVVPLEATTEGDKTTEGSGADKQIGEEKEPLKKTIRRDTEKEGLFFIVHKSGSACEKI